jgi:cyanate permease
MASPGPPTRSPGALGPILMGKAFDTPGSYEALLVRLALVTLAVATLMLALPRYDAAQTAALRVAARA